MGVEAIQAAAGSESSEDAFVPCEEAVDVHDLQSADRIMIVEAEEAEEGSETSAAAFVPCEVSAPELQVSDSCLSSCAICLDPIIERRCFHGILGQPSTIFRSTSDSSTEPGYCETPCGHTFHAKCLTELFEHLVR
eukprot:1332766-Rhodomonas_salina.3